MPDVIQVQGLSHAYDQKAALLDFSLSVAAGELHGLIGPDSAGKTTLMRILCGLLKVQQGQVRVLGLDLKTGYLKIRAHLGYMPQRFSLYQDLSVQENLMFFARLFGVPPAEREIRLPELYSFSRLEPFKNRKAGELSGGMKQKLALSCALMHRPELLILDEPTYGVDPVSRREFWQMLKSIQREGSTILVSTPYMDEAELCDRVSLLFSGRLLASDPPQTIIENWNKALFRVTANNLKSLEASIRKDEQVESVQLFGNELHLVMDTAGSEESILALESDFQKLNFAWQRINPGMEDIFLSFMQDDKAQNGG
jgi:ABC-2 type transport system ATP-binding protein